MTPKIVNDSQPGYRRRRCGKGWLFSDAEGKRITRTDPNWKRLNELVIPPAWSQVWICADERGHIQATGRDARGRKQYIYHPDFRARRDTHKFDRMAEFARALPQVRERVDADLRRRNFSLEKAQALAVRLLERTFIRVGNRQYHAQNGTHGLTTLRSSHIDVSGSSLRMEFKGKSGKWWEVELADPALARLLRRYQELPGDPLFQYEEEGELRTLDSGEVNAYLRDITEGRFTAKDFRTWGGTVLAAQELAALEPWTSQAQLKRQVNLALRRVASRLNNTLSVCRRYYVHPSLLDLYSLDGGERLREHFNTTGPTPLGLSRDEWLVARLLGGKVVASVAEAA